MGWARTGISGRTIRIGYRAVHSVQHHSAGPIIRAHEGPAKKADFFLSDTTMVMRTKPCIALLAFGAAAIIVCLIFQQNALKRLHTQNVDLRQQLETFTKAYSSTRENKESSELVRLRAEHEELLRL